jgi:glycosyltransferase involved in cell wall biosynthesis
MVAEPPEILLYVLDAGGGHRAAAANIVAAAERAGLPWRFDVVNLQDVLAPIDLARRLTGAPMEDTYNEMVRRGRTRFLVPLLRGLQWLIRRLRGPLVRVVAEDLRRRRPRLVVSLIPNFNAVIRDAVRAAHPGVPFAVVLTDLADFPPHFWIESGLDAVVVSTDDAAAQALSAGMPPERIWRVSGLLLHPRFYALDVSVRREATRGEIGAGAGDRVVVVLFGGKGSPEMRPLVEALLREDPAWHVVAICGDNPALFAGLAEAERSAGGRLVRLPFTNRVADYLAAADVLVTKPGPGSLAEAFHCGVPVVVTVNARTIPQERYNAAFVSRRGLGAAVASWREMPAAVRRLAQPDEHARVRSSLGALPPNRAVFELLELFETFVPRTGETLRSA